FLVYICRKPPRYTVFGKQTFEMRALIHGELRVVLLRNCAKSMIESIRGGQTCHVSLKLRNYEFWVLQPLPASSQVSADNRSWNRNMSKWLCLAMNDGITQVSHHLKSVC